MTPITETAVDVLTALPPPGGTVIDVWLTLSDWGHSPQPTKISLITGCGLGEHFAVIEQAPDARVILGENAIGEGRVVIESGMDYAHPKHQSAGLAAAFEQVYSEVKGARH